MAEKGVGEDGIKTLAVVGFVGGLGYLAYILMKEKEPPPEKEITSVRYE